MKKERSFSLVPPMFEADQKSMKRTILLLTLLLVACSPFVPQPTESPLPTAYIDPSYPTMQAAPAVMSQLSSGIEVRADRAWRDGKEVNVDVCFTVPDGSNWAIGAASLLYTDQTVFDFGSTLLSLQ